MECFKMYLVHGKYEEAEEMCKKMTFDRIKDLLLNVAYETENLYTLSFVQYMAERTKETSWIELAIDLLLNPLCFMEGAYSVALFYTRQLLLINRSIKNLERMLFFSQIPEKLVGSEEAVYISNEILKAEPTNKVALSTLADIR